MDSKVVRYRKFYRLAVKRIIERDAHQYHHSYKFVARTVVQLPAAICAELMHSKYTV
jgi:hypothetical protein